jgi:integrase
MKMIKIATGINKFADTGYYKVSYSKRHPITREARSLTRIENAKGEPIKSLAEAQRIREQMIIQVEKQFRKEKDSMKINWKELVTDYLEKSVNRGDIQTITADNMRACLIAHTFSKWGNRPIDSIGMGEIRDIIEVDLKGKSISHQKNILKYIRGAFNYAFNERLISSSPVPKMKFKQEEKLQTVLNFEQTKILLSKAKEVDSEWYPHWCMATYTGLRNGELYALKWQNVDFDKRQIRVVDSWTSKAGFKGNTKSSRHRIVEIAMELLLVLRELKLKSEDGIFVLPRIDKWDKGEQARELRLFLQYVGLPRIRFHDLRATWCTLILASGVEAIKVMKMGGWVEMQTMERYMRLAGVDIKGITDNFELHDHRFEPSNNVISLFGEPQI